MSAPERSRRARASEFASGLSFGFLDEAPELKSLDIDCLFDRIAGEVIGRSAVRPDRARGGPGTMVLRAFAGDLTGSRLPQNHGPWTATGAIGPDSAPPYNFSRDAIEEAIDAEGFQLWRFVEKTEA